MLYTRGRIYWINITGANGQPLRETSGTSDRKAAQEYHDQRKAEVWRIRQLGERPRIKLDDAIAQWYMAHAATKKSVADDKLRIRAMLPYLPNCQLREVTTTRLQRLHDDIVRARQCKPITANRYLEILSAVLHYGKRREWIENVPTIPYAKVRKVTKPFLSQQQAVALLNAMPEHLNHTCRFALATGLRDANVRLLTWDRIDLNRGHAWIDGDMAKGGKPIPVPLTIDAYAVLSECDPSSGYVFVYRGKPVAKRSNNTAFRNAREAVGLPWATFHLLRHTWASWHTMRGTPTDVLQQLGGWSTKAMVENYSHLAPGFAAQWAENSSIGTVAGTMHADVSGHYQEEAPNMGWLMGLEPTTTGITKPSRPPNATKNQTLAAVLSITAGRGKRAA